jgi:hypothetical protein
MRHALPALASEPKSGYASYENAEKALAAAFSLVGPEYGHIRSFIMATPHGRFLPTVVMGADGRAMDVVAASKYKVAIVG